MQSRTSTVRTTITTNKISVADRFLDQREKAAMAIDLAHSNLTISDLSTRLIAADK